MHSLFRGPLIKAFASTLPFHAAGSQHFQHKVSDEREGCGGLVIWDSMASTQEVMVRGSAPRDDRRVFGLCFEQPEKESIVDETSLNYWQDEADMGKSSYDILNWHRNPVQDV